MTEDGDGMDNIKTISKVYNISVNEDIIANTLSFWESRGFKLSRVSERIYSGKRNIKQLIKNLFGLPTQLTVKFQETKIEVLIEVEWNVTNPIASDRILNLEPEFYFYSNALYMLERDYLSKEEIDEYSKLFKKLMNQMLLFTGLGFAFLMVVISLILIPTTMSHFLSEIGMLLLIFGSVFLIEVIILYFIKNRDTSKTAKSYLKSRYRKLKSAVGMLGKPSND